MGDIRQRIRQMLFFFLKRPVLLPDPQSHFPDLALQDRQFSLFLFRSIQTILIVKHQVDLFGHPGDSPIPFSRKPKKSRPITGGQYQDQRSRRRAGQEYAGRRGHHGYHKKQSCKLPDLSISQHPSLPAGIPSPGPSG